MRRDSGLETLCAWIFVFLERNFYVLYCVIWFTFMSVHITHDVVRISAELKSNLQRPVLNGGAQCSKKRVGRAQITGGYETISNCRILFPTFYWYSIRNNGQRHLQGLQAKPNCEHKGEGKSDWRGLLRLWLQSHSVCAPFSSLQTWQTSAKGTVHVAQTCHSLLGSEFLENGCTFKGIIGSTTDAPVKVSWCSHSACGLCWTGISRWSMHTTLGGWRHDYLQPWVIIAYLAYA